MGGLYGVTAAWANWETSLWAIAEVVSSATWAVAQDGVTDGDATLATDGSVVSGAICRDEDER